LSTFGIGGEHTDAQWRSVIRQLIVRGYLHAEVERFGALVLTPLSRALLRGEINLQLREDVTIPAGPKKRRAVPKLTAPSGGLWDALRACRKELADAQGVPPYVIFHDATLGEMMTVRPRTHAELLSVVGVGKTKLERYGDAFLQVIAANDEPTAELGGVDAL
jgi:ATP-dependent DNA helicase RecQ